MELLKNYDTQYLRHALSFVEDHVSLRYTLTLPYILVRHAISFGVTESFAPAHPKCVQMF